MKEFLHSFSKLEFDKIKKQVERYVYSDVSRERIDNLLPLNDIGELRDALAYVTEMKRLFESNEAPPLNTIPDIRLSLHRTSIDNYALPAIELRNIAVVLQISNAIHSYFARRKTDFPILFSKINAIQLHKVLEYNISLAIDERGEVKDSATKELASIRRQIVDISDLLRKRLESILKNVAEKDYLQEEIITTRDARMVIPVKTEYKNRVPGFIHSSSASGATVFIEPTETLELNNDIRTLQFREQREIEKILKELTIQVGEARELLSVNLNTLAELDFIAAKAKYSIEILGSEPLLSENGRLFLINARHPLLLQHHRISEVVPLNMEIHDDIHTVVISGPNAGGKSVAMKTVGLLAIMAQSGFHIPAVSGSELPVFDEIFVDMGDEQSIENDLSSFSSHLRNLKELIEHVTPHSLVLIDEIGSGTDPVEGSSLAAAALEHLTTIGCMTIATTHHGSLKSFAHDTLGVINAAMEFNQETLEPTYRLKLGLPGSSYAMEMADRIDFPPVVVLRAKELRGSGTYNVDKLIEDLQRQSQQLSTELEETRKEKMKLDELTAAYKTKISSFQRDLREIKAKAIQEADAIVEKANTAIESTIKEIREHSAEKQIVKSARQTIKNLSDEVQLSKKDLDLPSEPVKTDFVVGDPVRLKDSNSFGEVIEKIDEEHYRILIGTIKISVRKKELLPTGRKQVVQRGQHLPEVTEVRQELDLRGMYGDEAIQAVEKFFDDAVLAGLHRVDIIHGKGTGALRKRVTQFLQNNRSVKSYRLGEWNEGGTGVTVVELA